jgi:hypothetical protein
VSVKIHKVLGYDLYACSQNLPSCVWLPVRMEPLNYHREDFREIFMGFLIRSFEKIQVWLKSYKNFRLFSRRPENVHMSLNSPKNGTKTFITKIVNKIKIHMLCQIHFFYKIPFMGYKKYDRLRKAG